MTWSSQSGITGMSMNDFLTTIIQLILRGLVTPFIRNQVLCSRNFLCATSSVGNFSGDIREVTQLFGQ